MKFEEVLPALREGKAIRRTGGLWAEFMGCHQLIDNQLWDFYEHWVDAIDVHDLLADDWEVIDLEQEDLEQEALDADIQDFEEMLTY